MNALDKNIRVQRTALPPLSSLEAEWRDLESRSEHSFFMSWAWIGLWLERLPDDVPRTLLRVEANGRLVALAVVCSRLVKRSGAIFSRAMFVNCTGDPKLDELTIEYNDLLVETGCEADVVRACVEFFAADPGWDELFLDGWQHAHLLSHEVLASAGAKVVQRKQRACHQIDLKALRAASTPYVDSLPSRTRYKVRRALREAEARGELTIDLARTPDEMGHFLAELKRLHQHAWNAKGMPGAFANEFFDGFHGALTRRPDACESVQLLCVRIGGNAIGYLYNLVHHGRVYNYQSGFDFEFSSGAAWRPGMLCHAMAIEFNASVLGTDVYDFMAGDQMHKRELGTSATNMLWIKLQRPRLKFEIEEQLSVVAAACRKAGALPVPAALRAGYESFDVARGLVLGYAVLF